ncbi:MAG TPA: CsbD family protein [Terriglobia bacterium]|nr:CsbD family protein [Terriglobia bacterium]
MNWDRVEGKWKQMRGSARAKWGRLTDDDLDLIAGHRDQLIGRLQERYGIARDEAEKETDEWATTLAEDY